MLCVKILMLIFIMSILSIIALPEELLINKHYLSVHLLQLDPSKGRMEEMQPLVVMW